MPQNGRVRIILSTYGLWLQLVFQENDQNKNPNLSKSGICQNEDAYTDHSMRTNLCTNF